MRNGVKKDIIPVLISYFENRRMIVKWHGTESSMRMLNGGGPQGALWGILEYLAQSNNNTDYISPNRKFKFIDDLSILEIINLLSIGILLTISLSMLPVTYLKMGISSVQATSAACAEDK